MVFWWRITASKIACNSLILLNRISRPSVCTFNYTSISNSLRENLNKFFAPIHIAERIAELILMRQFVGYSGAGYFVKKSNEVKSTYRKSSKICHFCLPPRASRLLAFSFLSQKRLKKKKNP